MPLYLLNTDALVHMVRRDATGKYLRDHYEPLMTEPRPLISVVTGGEIRSLAYQWNWGTEKRAQMAFLLGYFDRVPLTPEIEEAYGVLDAYSLRNGVRMGKNDIWIAAAAHVTGACLLTVELDFEHLHDVFISRELLTSDSA